MIECSDVNKPFWGHECNIWFMGRFTSNIMLWRLMFLYLFTIITHLPFVRSSKFTSRIHKNVCETRVLKRGHWIILVNITINVICKFHIKSGHFRILHCNLLLLTKYLVDKFYYYHQPNEVRLGVFTSAIFNVLVFWDVTPCNWAVNHQLS